MKSEFNFFIEIVAEIRTALVAVFAVCVNYANFDKLCSNIRHIIHFDVYFGAFCAKRFNDRMDVAAQHLP